MHTLLACRYRPIHKYVNTLEPYSLPISLFPIMPIAIIEIADTDYETDHLGICLFKIGLFVFETQTYYCKSRTHFAAYARRYRNRF